MAYLAAISAIVGLVSAGVSAQQQSDAGFRTKLANNEQATNAEISGDKQKAEADQEAIQLEESAKADRASSQRDAVEAQRRAQLSKSRALAVAAASGGDTLDPSVINILSGFDSEGQLAVDTALYNGDSSARGKEFGAFTKRNQGRDYAAAGRIGAGALQFAGEQARKAGNAQAGSTILNGASSFAKTYR